MAQRCALLVAAACVVGATEEVSQARVSNFHYIPGMALQDYTKGQRVNVSVNSLHSHEALVSYNFYSLPFCKPQNIDELFEEANYGQILWGEHIQASYYGLQMMQPAKCFQIPCADDQRKVPKADLEMFEKRINNGYRGNFVIDNLPVVNPGRHIYKARTLECHDNAPRGWPLGVPKKCTGDKTLIHNHLIFNITVNQHKVDRYIIVSVKVIPYSIDWEEHGIDKCTDEFEVAGTLPPLTTEGDQKAIHWTYGVKWHLTTEIDWSNRWDEYLMLAISNNQTKTHWASIINSLLIVLCLSAIVAMILLRTLHVDFNRYNSLESEDEQAEEMGWKLVHADVFRAPAWPGLFSVVIGTGVQLLGMVTSSILFAMLGFLSPANRGGLITAAMFLFVLMAIVNGAVTGIMLSMFQQRRWKIVFVSGLLFPGVLFTLWLGMEVYIQMNRKGANIAPIYTIVEIMGLWFGVSLPLVVLGAGFGFKVFIPTLPPLNFLTGSDCSILFSLHPPF